MRVRSRLQKAQMARLPVLQTTDLRKWETESREYSTTRTLDTYYCTTTTSLLWYWADRHFIRFKGRTRVSEVAIEIITLLALSILSYSCCRLQSQIISVSCSISRCQEKMLPLPIVRYIVFHANRICPNFLIFRALRILQNCARRSRRICYSLIGRQNWIHVLLKLTLFLLKREAPWWLAKTSENWMMTDTCAVWASRILHRLPVESDSLLCQEGEIYFHTWLVSFISCVLQINLFHISHLLWEEYCGWYSRNLLISYRRRQHRVGPINASWADLGLDEVKEKFPMGVISRRMELKQLYYNGSNLNHSDWKIINRLR